MREGMQVARNCAGAHPESGFALALAPDLVLKECPISALDPRALYLFSLFGGCHLAVPTQAGVVWVQHAWPSPGGLNDQLAIVAEAFQVMRAEHAAIQHEAARGQAKRDFLEGGS